MKEKNTVVDENDNVLGAKYREDIGIDEIYRVSALWIINSKDEILLARRGYSKKRDPGKWGPAVAGTIAENETYEENIKREAEEEIGVTNYDFGKGIKRFSHLTHKYFAKTFLAKLDWNEKDFKLDEREVAEVRWFSLDELKKEMKDHPEEFINTMPKRIEFLYPGDKLINFEELGE